MEEIRAYREAVAREVECEEFQRQESRWRETQVTRLTRAFQFACGAGVSVAVGVLVADRSGFVFAVVAALCSVFAFGFWVSSARAGHEADRAFARFLSTALGREVSVKEVRGGSED